MSTPSTLTDDIFAAFLKCRYKAYLKIQETAGEPSDYQRLQVRLAAEYRLAARQELLRTCDPAAVIVSPPSLAEAIQSRPTLILDATAAGADWSCRLDALERTPAGVYTPVLLAPRQRVEADDRMRLAFGAVGLARVQGSQPDTGRIVHGREFKSSRVSLPVLFEPVRDAVSQIRALQDSLTPPPLVLNRHCPECEFRRSCRATAVEKDDLSLLRGLSAKEIGVLHGRGIFTVTQFSHTFRPARLKRVKETGSRREHALQALAIREKKVYIAQRPRLPDGKVRAYLDVEGLPDRDFYYLIGLSIIEGGEGARRWSFWADREADEAGIWNAFLEAARGLGDDFVIHHYGSYETQFLERMSARHGGDPELVARLKAKAVNVLSAVHAGVYFPTYANDLKSVAGCLGFRWSDADASGLQSIVWRHAWESGNAAAKARLVTYNREDCSALEVVAAAVRSFGTDSPPAAAAGVEVAGADEIKTPTYRKYGNSTFALPAFASITKCAYFDYQRDKVLCRTSPAVKASLARKKRVRPPAYRINQEVEFDRPAGCPACGPTRLDQFRRDEKRVVDLKPFGSGVKRWVVRYKAVRYRCSQCWNTFLPADYLAHSERFGGGVCNWVAYSAVAHRQIDDGAADALRDLFGIHISPSSVGRLRQRAVERYQGTFDGLLAALRKGAVVHADETKVEIKGAGNAYVWVFASPDTAVYVYAPTREGATVAEALKGFKGVLVSDFYSAYDSVECPQQKCLVHLIRDLNDDLLKNPFDEDLKQLTARFTALLQPVIATIDRFGLKKYHLGKYKPAVERFFATTSEAEYKSEEAKHYRSRFLKNRGKLFTFLDHDGVPWNNNNAENAVKLFASRRKVMGTPFTERGIKDYLPLLSLYQTLRYRNLSLWKFLLSGETDLDAYTAKCR